MMDNVPGTYTCIQEILNLIDEISKVENKKERINFN